MNFFSKEKEKEELVLVFDVGSSSVGAVLFLANSSKPPKIIFSVREPILIETVPNFDHFFSSTIKSLDSIVIKVSKSGLGMPKKIFCVLSSPWYTSQTRHISIKKDESFVFSHKIADSVIQEEVVLFEKEQLKNFVEKGEKIQLIELKSMNILLNGYNALKLSNEKVKNVAITLFISASPEEILKHIKESINKYFNHENIVFASLLLSTFAVARDMFLNQEDFILVDVGAEITEISMVKKDILCASISFPLGVNNVIRSIALELKCSLDEARSYISLYENGHAESQIQGKLETIIKKIKNEWLAKFQDSLVNMSNDISIPATVFLTSEKEYGEFFTETIKAEQYNQYTITESKFTVVFIDVKKMNDFVLFGDGVSRDSFLMIESIYINRFIF